MADRVVGSLDPMAITSLGDSSRFVLATNSTNTLLVTFLRSLHLYVGSTPFHGIGIGANWDANNRLAVRGNAALFTGTLDHFNMTIDKRATANDGALRFQTNFVTHAIMGLLGDDNFTLKVSSDGSAFFQAINILKTTGTVAFGGATADSNNGAIFKGTNFLFTNSGGTVAANFNKNASGNDASFTFQTNFSARALLGLLGDDNFTFKVSPNGSDYTSAIIIDRTGGHVSHETGAKAMAFVNFDVYNAAGAWFKIPFNNTVHNDQSAMNTSTGAFVATRPGYYFFEAQYLFKLNGTLPTSLGLALSINNLTPLPYTRAQWGTPINQGTMMHTAAMLKLNSGDFVYALAFFGTNDGYVAASLNALSGVRIA